MSVSLSHLLRRTARPSDQLLRTSTLSSSPFARCTFCTSITARSESPKSGRFDRPAPPSLPADEQREFDRLVKDKANAAPFLETSLRSAPAAESDADRHPDARRLPTPDFEGDTNPLTGEVGGPKKEPLLWENEWSYGGRATDF